MNTYDAALRIFEISEELSKLSTKLGATSKPTDRIHLERKIDALEVEFFQLKHNMEKISIQGIR